MKFIDDLLFKQTILPQYQCGILDVDGLGFLIEALHCKHQNMENCFVLGGYEDYHTFLYVLSQRMKLSPELEPYRAQLIVREYEPHFLTLDLYITSDRSYLLVLDSTPDTINQVRKWLSLMNKYFPNVNVFANQERLQSDDHSCKMFCVNFVKRLAKLNPEDFYKHMKEHSDQENEIYVIREYGLPPCLMKDTQSIRKIQTYANLMNAQNLLTYVDKRSCVIIYDDKEDQTIMKLQNHSIYFSIKKYRALMESFFENLSSSDANIIIRKRLGFHMINKEHSIGPSVVEISYISEYVHVTFALTEITINHREDPIPQNQTSVFFKKHIETDYFASIPWIRYKHILKYLHPLDKSWIDPKYQVTYRVDLDNRKGILIGTVKDLKEFLWKMKLKINVSPINVLKTGCSQLLATYMLLHNIQNTLIH